MCVDNIREWLFWRALEIHQKDEKEEEAVKKSLDNFDKGIKMAMGDFG